uniref:Putative secreted protein n=1 Tax=Ixodes scapularis TaxID=6945 RepID=A0A4D5RE26_IXOSC
MSVFSFWPCLLKLFSSAFSRVVRVNCLQSERLFCICFVSNVGISFLSQFPPCPTPEKLIMAFIVAAMEKMPLVHFVIAIL